LLFFRFGCQTVSYILFHCVTSRGDFNPKVTPVTIQAS
jgi:hypothetical protein